MRIGRGLAVALGIASVGVGLGPSVLHDITGGADPGALPLGAVTLLAAAASLLWHRTGEVDEQS